MRIFFLYLYTPKKKKKKKKLKKEKPQENTGNPQKTFDAAEPCWLTKMALIKKKGTTLG